jgi:dienelactone hydrolase
VSASPSHAVLAALAAALVAAGAGCSGQASAAATIAVDHPSALADTPLHVRIAGLGGGERVTVQATSTNDHQQWLGFATFQADARGAIDMATAGPSGSLTYTKPEAMGLFRSMGATGAPAGPLSDPVTSMRIALTVRDGSRTLATRTVTRVFTAPGVTEHSLTFAQDGFIGHYYAPAATDVPQSAVLVAGGGEGGLAEYLDATAALLASHGHPALAIGYFGLPSLPTQLANVRLEYFIGALTWLRGQPGVDRSRVFTYGVSRGSEAALLLGALRPDLVHGVAAMVPSDVVHCAFPSCAGPSWTLNGAPLPYTSQFLDPNPADAPDSVIPVERIAGPVLLVCGESDREWPSCPYARAADARLAGRPGAQLHELRAYPGAGHKVGLVLPYQPDDGTRADSVGQADAWPRVLDLLAATG